MLQTTVQHKQISNVANQIQIKDRKKPKFERIMLMQVKHVSAAC